MSRRRSAAVVTGGLAVIGIVLAAYESDVRSIRRKVLAGSEIATTAAGPIEYASAGAGMPLLSIHGASGGYDQGLMIATALVGDTFQVIAPSRFGYLRTPLPDDPSPTAQADAHAALLDSLGVERAVVVGVSAGAPSAVQLALRHPNRVAALVLLSPLGYAPGPQAPLPGGTALLKLPAVGADFAYWAILRLRPSALIRFMGVPPQLIEGAGPDDDRWVSILLHAGLPLSMRLRGIGNDLSVRLAVRTEDWPLERITAPTLILTCSDDLFGTEPAARYAAAHIAGATLVVYRTGGHLFIGHLAEVRDTVNAFLARTLGASATRPAPDGVHFRRPPRHAASANGLAASGMA